jgi:hypothetical protein
MYPNHQFGERICAVSLMFWLQSRHRRSHHSSINRQRPHRFGLSGANPYEPLYYTNLSLSRLSEFNSCLSSSITVLSRSGSPRANAARFTSERFWNISSN